ncbi:hypothetical protein [uncultured Rhodospira sp.]|uniref:hypothetical protein n=1 Tax=uncultured Rhodospira sp. TaxID=1936189 RepID=UPI0026070C83|nr:hypothetical protein [uncultured Rhodospira sp.]
MAALTADRNTPARDLKVTTHPVAADATIFAGAIVALDTATGHAVPAATATGLRGLGCARAPADNAGGDAGDVSVEVWRGCFRWANDGSIDRTHIGAAAYAEDDQTVAATDGSGTRSAIGTIADIDDAGVWVTI